MLLPALLLFLPGPVPLPQPDPAPRVREVEESSDPARPYRLGSTWKVVLGPQDRFYGPYVAEQRRPSLGIKSIGANQNGIAGAGESRWGLRVGREFPIARFYRGADADGGIQLDGEVGILAQFDRDNSTDNIGWDGLYGLYLSWKPAESLAMRVGASHNSSHLGDEFIESTGRTRIMYTREEILVGLSWQAAPEWRTYGEYGWGYDLRNEQLMEEGRAQAGVEWEALESPWNGRSRPYAAVDVDAYQEDDWELNVTLQAGVLLPNANGSHWRFGIEIYDGRSPIGEFFQSEETYASWGVWLEL